MYETDLTYYLDEFQKVGVDKLPNIIKILLTQKEYFIYKLICFYLDDYKRTGILVDRSRKEIQGYFNLKKSQISILISKACKHGIIINLRRKYKLNLDCILVQRLWLYYFSTRDNFTQIPNETLSLLNEQKKLKNKLEKLEKIEKEITSINKTRFDEFIDDIEIELLYGDNDIDLFSVCKKYQKLLLTFNI